MTYNTDNKISSAVTVIFCAFFFTTTVDFFKDNKDNGNNRKNRRNCGCHEVTYNTDNIITTNGIVVSVVSVVVKIIMSSLCFCFR